MIQLEVWGDYALFTRPELKAERVSYDVPTPSAARGILDAIYYHPGLVWRIDRIYVMKPIRFMSIMRNEVKSKASIGKAFIDRKNDITQRSSLVLCDVRYVIEAHFDMTEKATTEDNPGKFQDIVRRRIERGQCFHSPYFGCREFPVSFRMWKGGTPETIHETRDLGLMLYDLEYGEDITPCYFRAKLEDGVLDLREAKVLR